MKNLLTITGAIAFLLIIWAFVTGKISIGKNSASSNQGSPEVQKVGESSLGTGTGSQIANPNNVKSNPTPTPRVRPNNVTQMSNTKPLVSSDYSVKVTRPASFQNLN